jgi:hypothetical protein
VIPAAAKFQFSLAFLLTVMLTTGVLFGLTFDIYSGGFTPGNFTAEYYRGEKAPPGKQFSGNFSTFGHPFTNFESGATVEFMDTEYTTVQQHARYVPFGIAANAVFWLLFSGLLCYYVRRIFLKRSKSS